MSYFPPGQHVINVEHGERVIAYSVTMGEGLSPEGFEALQKDLDKVMALHLGERELRGVIWNGDDWVKASQAQLKKALDGGEDYDGPQVAILEKQGDQETVEFYGRYAGTRCPRELLRELL